MNDPTEEEPLVFRRDMHAFDAGHGLVVESELVEDGSWVLYEDHEMAVEKLRERVRELEAELADAHDRAKPTA